MKLGFSSCPNDTFIFDALVNHKIDTRKLSFEVFVSDVEELNTLAMSSRLDVTKVSYAAYLQLVKDYVLLDSGSALGRGCGPLLIANKAFNGDMSGLTVAIPGLYTTANLLLGFAYPQINRRKVMLFSEIEDAVLNGEVDLGLIIHESRFTYLSKGLMKIADLGEIWEQRTGLPIPLGGIIAKRSLGLEKIILINTLIRQSLEFAYDHPGAANAYIKSLAQETGDAIIQQHIDLYVNTFSLNLGPEGRAAVETLFSYAAGAGLISAIPAEIFLQ
ncbi:MAG: 1,4-dihydroxy-6-naphthoate synthase [Bacteroidales bacterium]